MNEPTYPLKYNAEPGLVLLKATKAPAKAGALPTRSQLPYLSESGVVLLKATKLTRPAGADAAAQVDSAADSDRARSAVNYPLRGRV